jgi:hypothetical protein
MTNTTNAIETERRAAISAALAAYNWTPATAEALMKAVEGIDTDNLDSSRLWCDAMNLRFGTGGLHKSRCDASGFPLPETLEAFPDIRFRMAESLERAKNIASKGRYRI